MLILDKDTRQVVIDGAKVVNLQNTSFRVLEFLIENEGKPVSRDDLILTLHGLNALYEGMDNTGVDKVVSRLRGELGMEDGYRYIQTLRRYGWKFVQHYPAEQVTADLTIAEAEIVRLFRSLSPADRLTMIENASWLNGDEKLVVHSVDLNSYIKTRSMAVPA